MLDMILYPVSSVASLKFSEYISRERGRRNDARRQNRPGNGLPWSEGLLSAKRRGRPPGN